MAEGKIEVLLAGPPKPTIVNGLAPFTVHRLADAKDRDALLREIGPRVRAMAVSVSSDKIGAELMSKLPKLEIVSTFAVGYDHVDVKWAAEHGITVTNTPKVLNEEVADTVHRIKPSAVSATSSLSTFGVFVTVMPCSAAHLTSTWS